MKVLILSDGHGAVDMLEGIAAEAKAADIVLYGGDFAALGDTSTGLPFLERLAALHDRVFAVTGNCDEPDFKDPLEEYDMSIEGSLSYFGGLVFAGSGGGMKFTGTTANERSDEDLVGDLRLVSGLDRTPTDDLDISVDDDVDADDDADDDDDDDDDDAGKTPVAADTVEDSSPWNNLIIIAHNPPALTKLDVISNGMHVGSPLLRKFIDTQKPLLAVSGHIHESAAIDTLGPTTLVNPGSLAEGRYAVAEISGGNGRPFAIASVELKSF